MPTPELIADVFLYPTDRGGRTSPISKGYRCPCFVAKDGTEAGWDCVVVGGGPVAPGERAQLGLIFLSGAEAVKALTQGPKFYLWEGRFIGEATAARHPN